MQPIHALIVEDQQNDCDLLIEHLKANGFDPAYTRVETEPEMIRSLSGNQFDVIICDYSLPVFDAFKALEIAIRLGNDTPLIIVSGSITTDSAIKALQAGAKDYILKADLTRLTSAISREMKAHNDRKLQRKLELELKKKEIDLQQAQKLEAIGQLAGGIAHDYNNLLAIISLNVEDAISQLSEFPEIKSAFEGLERNLHQIRKTSKRGVSLTRQLLGFCRSQVSKPKIVNLNGSITEVQEMLARLLPENIKFKFDLEKNIGKIKIDPGQLEQIILNLAINARDAMPSGGEIQIKTSNKTVSDKNSGHYVILEVTDTGCGMTEEVRKRIFDPFFTTKEKGKGTGLGLSIVYGIVKKFGGSISVESKVNVGTSFKISFPLTLESEDSSSIDTSQVKALKGDETILIVEDDSDLRHVTAISLMKKGYKVLEASHGQEALEILKERKESVSVVVTDVVMPMMGGVELFAKAQDLKFQGKFIFLSGFAEDAKFQEKIRAGQVTFVEKPYMMDELLGSIRNLIGQKKIGT